MKKGAGDILADWLKRTGTSQHELSSMTGITQAMISKIISQRLFMSASTALILEDKTGLSARELLIADVDYKLSSYKKDSSN